MAGGCTNAPPRLTTAKFSHAPAAPQQECERREAAEQEEGGGRCSAHSSSSASSFVSSDSASTLYVLPSFRVGRWEVRPPRGKFDALCSTLCSTPRSCPTAYPSLGSVFDVWGFVPRLRKGGCSPTCRPLRAHVGLRGRGKDCGDYDVSGRAVGRLPSERGSSCLSAWWCSDSTRSRLASPGLVESWSFD